ncbi:MAG TPA: hypothetical protein VMZ06_02410 [Candidatus Bathyarchaeia archaeon]|nr:hypothetical protein [Candidatus Bathyarchaeia archaeon]
MEISIVRTVVFNCGNSLVEFGRNNIRLYDHSRADVQGAKPAGIMAVHVAQWQSHQIFEHEPDRFEPDALAASRADLQTILLP